MSIIFAGLGCAVVAYIGISHLCNKIDKISMQNEALRER